MILGSGFFAQIYLTELVSSLRRILFSEFKSSTKKFFFLWTGTKKKNSICLPSLSIFVHLSFSPPLLLSPFHSLPTSSFLLYIHHLVLQRALTLCWKLDLRLFILYERMHYEPRAYLYLHRLSVINVSQLELVCNSSHQIKQDKTGNIQNHRRLKTFFFSCASGFCLFVLDAHKRLPWTPLALLTITLVGSDVTYLHCINVDLMLLILISDFI